MIDKYGKFLTKAEILELCKTKQGQRVVAEYIYRARSAYASQRVMEILGVEPDSETQQNVCLAIFNIIFSIPTDEIFEYVDSIKEHSENEPIHEC